MPLFSSRFTPRKTSPRKSSSVSSLHRDMSPRETQTNFGVDSGITLGGGAPILLKLGSTESTFEDGQWVTAHCSRTNDATVSKEVSKLQKQNKEVHEQNSLLKLKVEILLDMLAETTAELHAVSRENKELKSALNPRRSKKQ